MRECRRTGRYRPFHVVVVVVFVVILHGFVVGSRRSGWCSLVPLLALLDSVSEVPFLSVSIFTLLFVTVRMWLVWGDLSVPGRSRRFVLDPFIRIRHIQDYCFSSDCRNWKSKHIYMHCLTRPTYLYTLSSRGHILSAARSSVCVVSGLVTRRKRRFPPTTRFLQKRRVLIVLYPVPLAIALSGLLSFTYYTHIHTYIPFRWCTFRLTE
jgi:hypothetical protein